MPKVKGTPAVRFILQSTKEPKQPAYVFLYFYYKGQRLKYSTGEKVCPEAWNKGRAVANAKYPENTDVNLRLNELEKFTVEIFRETDGKIDPVAFRRELDYRMGYRNRPADIPSHAPDFLRFIETFYQERKMQPNANKGTLKVLHKVKVHLETYAAEKGKKLTYQDINQPFFYDFRAWLFAPPRSLQTNYVHKIFGIVKMFMRDAKRRGYHTNDVFENFSIKKEKTTKIALSFDELEALYRLDLTDNTRLERVRDLFLIGAYSGLRFSDFSRLSPEHITTVEGEKMIQITTQKTGEQVFIPLFPILETLLTKYRFAVPKISSQKMNDYLKELGQLAGLDEKIMVTNTAGGRRKEHEMERWEKLTTHVARRSFATNFYRAGLPAFQIMKITGHQTEQAFRQYICIDAKMAAMDFAKDAARVMKRPGLKVTG
ncbi:MAG: phage integrase SAM-like domain-containing protein [Saprospiraceae bacterium]